MNNNVIITGFNVAGFVDYAIENKLSRQEVTKYLHSCSEREVNELKSIIKEKVEAKTIDKYSSSQNLSWLLYEDEHKEKCIKFTREFGQKLDRMGIHYLFNEVSNYSDNFTITLSVNGLNHVISSYAPDTDIAHIAFGIYVGTVNN